MMTKLEEPQDIIIPVIDVKKQTNIESMADGLPEFLPSYGFESLDVIKGENKVTFVVRTMLDVKEKQLRSLFDAMVNVGTVGIGTIGKIEYLKAAYNAPN